MVSVIADPLTCTPHQRTTQSVRNDHGGEEEDTLADEILTNSPCSYSSASGVQPPYNSYTSPAGSDSSASQKQDNQSSAFHAPKVLDRKGLARRIKKFTKSLKRSKGKGAAAAPIRTLANL
jgi:hypothetical protein